MVNDVELAKAAFVVLYDVSIASKSTTLLQGIEDVIDNIRKKINRSRKEAQYILQHPDAGDTIEAALVLVYEGFGKHRMEADFSFDDVDIVTMSAVRQQSRMSMKRAISILQAHV